MQEPCRNVVFIDGCRTPFLRSGTGFRELSSYDLGRIAVLALLKRISFDPGKIDAVVMGTVVSRLATTNVARESALGAGLSPRIPAFTVTQACASANRAIASGAEMIRTGEASIVLAGGTESLTDIPICYRRRFRNKLIESRRYRSAWDYFKLFQGVSFSDLLPEMPSISEFSTGRTMGEDSDRLAARLGISRGEQDAYALRSHAAAARATADGLLAPEIETVMVPPDFVPVTTDNGFRANISLEQLAKLPPAFVKPYGTVTAGNSSFLTDGAALIVIAGEEAALQAGLSPRAFIRDCVFTGQDPREELLLGPAYAIPKLLDRSGLKLSDIDVFELHEAFAGQVLANLASLASDRFAKECLGRNEAVGAVPLARLNPLGGSLSLGHPFGATGARLVTTAANRLLRENGRYAVVATCAAGGIGNAILLERYTGRPEEK